MKYLDKLKKERSVDRVIFLAGMVLAFVGFLIPTVYVKMAVAEPVDNTIESEVEEDDNQGSAVGDDDFYDSLINGTAASDDEDGAVSPTFIGIDFRPIEQAYYMINGCG